jgi:hypothetical protein
MALAGFLGGYVLKAINDSIKELRRQDAHLTSEVHQIHILVAGSYVKRDELEKHIDALFESLRRIEEKLDGKADK